MKNQFWFFVIISCFWPIVGCVSLDISPKTTPSKELSYKSPAGFESTGIENLDASWSHKSTGNSISIKSSCYDPADPSLEELESSALAGLFVSNKVSSEKIEFNQREALHSKTLVKIDGIKVLVEMLIFKKNNCNYLINHVGIEPKFKYTSTSFANFLSTVNAP